MGWISPRTNTWFSDSKVPWVFVSIDPSSTGSAWLETKFVCSTESGGVLVVSMITAAAETARVRDRKYIVRNQGLIKRMGTLDKNYGWEVFFFLFFPFFSTRAKSFRMATCMYICRSSKISTASFPYTLRSMSELVNLFRPFINLGQRKVGSLSNSVLKYHI